jgi:LPXTG-motif cell wall-anchored protein
MNFLLNATGDNTILIVLAIGIVLAVGFYIFKGRKANAENSNDVIATETTVTDEGTNVVADNDEEIIAVIAAAIAMAESESNGLKFKVVSFRRI